MNQLNVNDISYLCGRLNTHLHSHIQQLTDCLKDDKFSQWYWYKFCKYVQKVDMQDLRCLVESINNFLTEQEAKNAETVRKFELNKSIDELKQCCKDNGGDLSEVLVLANGRHFIIGVDSFDDCMNDIQYFIDSRYGIRFKDIEGWFLLRA
ncbi:hypothetical protein BJD49_gp029 [Acinetobacter phage vB_AbaM_phiAbaA1]|uniref:hypothetical protein n=1 Tax=Acinetobacter phage vB_AbaM_phiAbaA1 TaxID=1605379 RepID=UPI00078DD5DA|nr:hypothetical protein BJD49_gp029 [Acinetobacter phage vB_AbaM_phiAbaA1]AJK27261.1 hypothetical protein phiAbaA1_158 [Acinetobacter phage vB_AbaM_phiAbaA1]